MTETAPVPDAPLLALTDELCRIPSWWRPAAPGRRTPEHNEMDVAEAIVEKLRACPWLDVQLVEVAPGRPNVLAFDGDPAQTALLVAGHIDTVPPSGGWTVPAHSVRGGRYHALGAADTKGAIAAALDAIRRAGPTRGAGYLFYCDEEFQFLGMKHFVAHHDEVRPEATLSVCGAPAMVMSGCRGLLEISLSLRGHGGHASRPHSGRSATLALHALLGELARWAFAQDQPYRTVLNVAAIRAGSLPADAALTAAPPTLAAIPNRIPDAAWALLELRTGSDRVTGAAVKAVVEGCLARMNAAAGGALPITLAGFDVHLEMPGYASEATALRRLTAPFQGLHRGRCAEPSSTGYLDIALIAGRDGSPALCMGPEKGGAHGADEWLDLESQARYRDGLVDLIRQQAPDAAGG